MKPRLFLSALLIWICNAAFASGRDTTIIDTVKDHYLLWITNGAPELKFKLVDSLLKLPCDTSILKIHITGDGEIIINYDILHKIEDRWIYNSSYGFTNGNINRRLLPVNDSASINPLRHLFMMSTDINKSSGDDSYYYFVVIKGEIAKSLILEKLEEAIPNSLIKRDLKFFASVDKFFLQRKRPSVIQE